MRTTLLRHRAGSVPVFSFRPPPGAPPIGVNQLPGEQAWPPPKGPHSHDFIALAYFERPGGSLAVGGDRWTVDAGDLVVIAPGDVVDYEPAPWDGDEHLGWGVFFGPEALGARDSGLHLSWRAHPLLFPFIGGMAGAPQRLRVPPDQRGEWTARITALWDELHRGDDGHPEAMRAHLSLLLVAVARLAGPMASDVRLRKDPFLARVFSVIDQRYHEGISLADVADALSLTPGHLTTVVRQRTGRTVLEWVTERRMTEARRLLVQSDLAVREIGRRVGYPDPAYFTRVFRRSHGATPTGWRRSALTAQSP